MLQNIRDKAQGWIAYGIVILISVPFALWGIQEYLGIGSEPVAAAVNGNEISERALDAQFQTFRQRMRERLGSAYRPELFDDNRMRQQVLERMVGEELIEQVSYDMGLRVNDAQVHTILLGMEEFQIDGRFDQQTFERLVRLQGLTPAGFMERVRKAILTQQLAQAVGSSTFITDYEAAEAQRLMKQQREFSYFVVPAADYLTETPVSDDQVNAYYTEHMAEFVVSERVKLSYLHLDAKIAGDTVEVTDELLRGYYDGNLDLYGVPEQRKASHILIQVAQDADDAAVAEAKAKVDALQQRLAKGEDFAELARANSQDPGSAANGGDLGYFGRGMMDPAFETATFALKPDQISEPVRSNFGFHLIKLVDIKAGHTKPFEEAKQEVERAYRKAEGERLYFEMAERLADLSYEDPSSLEPAADALGLTIQHSDWVTREQGEGVLASPKALAAAFSEDVLVERNNSELVELDTESSLVLRVEEHEESSNQPLEEVRERIVERLRRQNAEAQALAEAEKRMQEIQGGTSLQQAAGDFAVLGPLSVERTDRSVPAELLGAIFSSAKPAQGEATVDRVRLANGDLAVYALDAVKEGSADEGAEDMMRQRLSRDLGRSLYDELVADLKSHADIEILLKKSDE
ncbi:MAG: SurA N-terminal domain-containing protein [Candidatus Thiodiazotropha sp.]